MLKETRKQADASQGQLAVMRAGQRPWLGLGSGINLKKAEYRLNPPPFGFYLISEGTYVIKNYGTSPAFNVRSSFNIQWPSITGDATTRPDAKWIDCPDQDSAISGSVVFPSSSFIDGFSGSSTIATPNNVTEVGRVWLLGCITYRDGDDHKVIHHTKVWLRSAHPDNAQWIVLSPTFRYMPITGFESWGEEAD